MIKKILIILLIIIAVTLFFALDLKQYLTIPYLKSARNILTETYHANMPLTIIIYLLIYIAITALSLPGAAVLTIAGGALMGFSTGVIVVSFASTIGATLACSVSRYLLRDWVQDNFGDRLKTINEGIEKEGAFYLFTLRLVPVIPFFVINLLMGLTKMRLLTFYWVSQLGMLAGTMVYVNAGSELGKIKSPSEILSPGLLVSFALIGIFPLIIKKIVDLYKARTNKKSLS